MRDDDPNSSFATEEQLDKIIEQERMRPHWLTALRLLVFAVLASKIYYSAFFSAETGEKWLVIGALVVLYLRATISTFNNSKKELETLRKELAEIKQRGPV